MPDWSFGLIVHTRWNVRFWRVGTERNAQWRLRCKSCDVEWLCQKYVEARASAHAHVDTCVARERVLS